MNNEAITTVADHRAPPARSTLDRDSGFSFHGSLLLEELQLGVDFRTSVCQCLVHKTEIQRL